MVTRSSTESEIVALSDATTQIMWFRRWLAEQGYDVAPIKVYQDNMAVLDLMRSPRRTSQRTKHLDVRLFYARDLEEEGHIELEWLPTKHMVADLLTKPLQGFLFMSLCAELKGYLL